MNGKLKVTLIILGFASVLLIGSQLTLGLMIVRAGGQGADAASLRRLITTHQHTGYLTVVVSLAYIALSLAAIGAMPGRSKLRSGDPVNQA